MELKKTLTDQKLLLALLILIYVLTYSFSYPDHAFQNDENNYIRLGYQMLDGEYSAGIADRAPLLPFLVSVSLYSGMNVAQIRFVLPLLIGIAFLLSAYLLSRKLTKNPIIPVAILLTFPFIWQWQPFLLVDTLLGMFASLAVLSFYKSLHENRNFLYQTSLLIALAVLTKISAIILVPAFFIYLVYKRQYSLLKSKEFIFSVVLGVILLTAVTFDIYMMTGSFGLNLRFMSVDKFFRVPHYYFLYFALVPWTLLFLYSSGRIVGKRKDEYMYSLIGFLTVFVFFSLLVWKEMRFLIFILPLYAIVAENGLAGLGRKTKYTILALFLVIGAAQSALILNGISTITWGTDIATEEIISLEKDSVIAFDSIFIYHPELKGRVLGIPPGMTYQEVVDQDPDYIVLSLYGEIARGTDSSYYEPTLGPFKVPFSLGSQKTVLDWWPGLPFLTDMYKDVSRDYSLQKRITRKGQDVFLIFKKE